MAATYLNQLASTATTRRRKKSATRKRRRQRVLPPKKKRKRRRGPHRIPQRFRRRRPLRGLPALLRKRKNAATTRSANTPPSPRKSKNSKRKFRNARRNFLSPKCSRTPPASWNCRKKSQTAKPNLKRPTNATRNSTRWVKPGC